MDGPPILKGEVEIRNRIMEVTERPGDDAVASEMVKVLIKFGAYITKLVNIYNTGTLPTNMKKAILIAESCSSRKQFIQINKSIEPPNNIILKALRE